MSARSKGAERSSEREEGDEEERRGGRFGMGKFVRIDGDVGEGKEPKREWRVGRRDLGGMDQTLGITQML